MTEIRFYYFETRPLAAVLYAALRRDLDNGWRVLVHCIDAKMLNALDDALWKAEPEGFLPHGRTGEGDEEGQPILLSASAEPTSGAKLRYFTSGADLQATLAAAAPPPDTAILLFDGANEIARDEARALWATLKAQGAAPTHWREGDDGEWTKQR